MVVTVLLRVIVYVRFIWYIHPAVPKFRFNLAEKQRNSVSTRKCVKKMGEVFMLNTLKLSTLGTSSKRFLRRRTIYMNNKRALGISGLLPGIWNLLYLKVWSVFVWSWNYIIVCDHKYCRRIIVTGRLSNLIIVSHVFNYLQSKKSTKFALVFISSSEFNTEET